MRWINNCGYNVVWDILYEFYVDKFKNRVRDELYHRLPYVIDDTLKPIKIDLKEELYHEEM